MSCINPKSRSSRGDEAHYKIPCASLVTNLIVSPTASGYQPTSGGFQPTKYHAKMPIFRVEPTGTRRKIFHSEGRVPVADHRPSPMQESPYHICHPEPFYYDPNLRQFFICASTCQSMALKVQQRGTSTKMYAPLMAEGPPCCSPDVDHRPCRAGCDPGNFLPVCKTGTNRLGCAFKTGLDRAVRMLVKTPKNMGKPSRTNQNALESPYQLTSHRHPPINGICNQM